MDPDGYIERIGAAIQDPGELASDVAAENGR